MTSVIDILEQLECAAGSNLKKEILEVNRKNQLLKDAFIAAFDPYTVYHVNKFKMPVPISSIISDDDIVHSFLYECLPELSSRNVTGNEAKDLVVSHFEDMTEVQRKWCQRILLKNMRCGVQETTVNKIWPGTLKSFAVALATTLKSEFVKGEGIKILGSVKYPVRVEPKLDGLRCIALKRNDEVTFYTRNGTILETLPTIKAALEKSPIGTIVLDGEAMGVDWNESASILMSSKTKKDDKGIVFNVFDAITIEEWNSQKGTLSYAERVKLVEAIVTLVQGFVDNAPVRQVPHINARDESELKAYFSKCMDEGFEGVMIKSMDTPYAWKRSDNIRKLKSCTTFEGVIVGHYEGRRGSKREGFFGGFELMLANGIVTRIGGGFNDAFRAQVQLEGPDTFIGRFAEIEAQPDPTTAGGLSKDGKARFPVFIRFRDRSDVDKSLTEINTK